MNKPVYLSLLISEIGETVRDELNGKIIKEFMGLRAKTHSYLTDDNDESKKKIQKMFHKKPLKFEGSKNFLLESQPENKTVYLNNNKCDVKSLTENHKEFTSSNKLIN